MKSYIKEVVAIVLFCGMSVMGEESQDQLTSDFAVRTALRITPGVSDLSYYSGAISGETKADDGGRLEVLAVKRYWSGKESQAGGTLGGGLFVGRQDGREDGTHNKIEISSFGAMIQGGLALRGGDHFIFELTPYVGVGGAQNRIKGFSIENGPYYFYGIKGGFFFELSQSIELGLELGYEGFKQEVEYENMTIKSTGSGFSGGLVLAVKF